MTLLFKSLRILSEETILHFIGFLQEATSFMENILYY
jgi:hypothetical protein